MLISEKIILSIGIMASIGLIIEFIRILIKFKPDHELTRDQIREIKLEKLSELWLLKEKVEEYKNNPEQTKIKNTQELSQPAAAQKDNAPKDKNIIPKKNPEFSNKKITDFYTHQIDNKPYFIKQPLQTEICIFLLFLLDKEGDIPSVVDKNNIPEDFESILDNNTFNIYKNITLTDHTLNVCKNIVDILTKDNSKHLIANAIIGGLGHDLGKLESQRSELFALGDHSLAAGFILSNLKGFTSLPKKTDILSAIKLHHKHPACLIGKILKKADTLAREQEISEHTPSVKAMTTAQIDKKEPVTPIKEAVQSALNNIKANNVINNADISSWFNPEEFINQMKSYINRISNGMFMAVSMPTGHVYFQVKVLEEIAKKQAKAAGNLTIPAIPAGDKNMRPILIAITDHFKKEGKIACEFIEANFFGRYFTVMFNTGKKSKGYYTPFLAKAFGDITALEALKSPMTKNIQSIEVFHE